MGAIQTPKLLMLSGIGDEDDLRPLGVPMVQYLPGVGENLQDQNLQDQNLQDHVSFGCCSHPVGEGQSCRQIQRMPAAITL